MPCSLYWLERDDSLKYSHYNLLSSQSCIWGTNSEELWLSVQSLQISGNCKKCGSHRKTPFDHWTIVLRHRKKWKQNEKSKNGKKWGKMWLHTAKPLLTDGRLCRRWVEIVKQPVEPRSCRGEEGTWNERKKWKWNNSESYCNKKRLWAHGPMSLLKWKRDQNKNWTNAMYL